MLCASKQYVSNYSYLKQAFNRKYGSWGLTYGICQFIDRTYSGFEDILMLLWMEKELFLVEQKVYYHIKVMPSFNN